MPRRKYGRLTKPLEIPPKDNCSRCRSGTNCPIPGHKGNEVRANRQWTGPDDMDKRQNKKKPGKKR